MKRLLKNLFKLQEIDTRLNELKLQKGDLPQMIEQVQDDLEEKKTFVGELQGKVENLQKDRRMFELEIEASREQLKKYENQLYQVKTNKEYDAISLEIDTKKSQIQELENKVLQTLEEEEEIKKQLEEFSSDLNRLDNQLTEYRKELEEISQLTNKEEARLLNDREHVTRLLDKSTLRQYERIRKAKGGIAVATIERFSCGGCFSAIPPQKIVEIRQSSRLFTCENCGRILVWIED